MSESGTSEPSLAIIVAMPDPAGPAFDLRLARFAEEAGPGGEVYVIDSSGSLSAEWMATKFPNVRVLYRPNGQLAPQLWRDGLVRTEAELVAFSTSQMTLQPGWRESILKGFSSDEVVGVGGAIQPSTNLKGADCALALLRYANYFPPLAANAALEPPGDNAVYRRNRLVEVDTSWADGFWEVEVHRALRASQFKLAMVPEASATFEGGLRLASMLRQRMLHGRRYGMLRSESLNLAIRAARVLTAPLVVPLLLLRSLKPVGSGKVPFFAWLGALGPLLILSTSWAIGEAIGMWQGRPLRVLKVRQSAGKKRRSGVP